MISAYKRILRERLITVDKKMAAGRNNTPGAAVESKASLRPVNPCLTDTQII
jgi:hypothetical protein